MLKKQGERTRAKVKKTAAPPIKTKGKKEKTDWGEEMLSATGAFCHAVLKALTYFLNFIFTVILICAVTGIIVGTAFAVYVKNYIDPELDETLFTTGSTTQTTTLYYYKYTDRKNRIGEAVELEDQRLYGTQNSMWASYTAIPQDLKDAFVSIEDKRFWDHDGVDWIRTTKAMLNFFVGFNDATGGGSTITQQLIKNLTDYDDVTIQRKVQEMLNALNLEKTKSKEEILELYLNIVPLSQKCYGVQAAASTYFNKDVSELSLIECVSLASITKYPTKYDPIQNPENNRERRDFILELMLEQGYITTEEFELAYDKELTLNVQPRSVSAISTNSWYTDTVIEDIISDLMEQKGYTRQLASNLLYSGGLSIYTLMDPEIQSVMEEAYYKNSPEDGFPANSSGIPAESAMVITDPVTGDLLGIVGARGEKSANLILNYATQTKRPPGSSFKPISVYAPAIEEGIINWASVYDDVPVSFEPYPWPGNTPAYYYGLTNIRAAIQRSANTIAVRVLMDLGIEKSFSYLTGELGITTLVERGTYADGSGFTDKGLAALALGQPNYGCTVREMAAAYGALANKGIFNKCRSYLYVYDSNGDILLSNDYKGSVVFSEQTAFITTKLLETVVQTGGTASRITLDNYVNVAGKTGTSNNDYDRWFVGYTPYYVGAVWYGYATPKNMTAELATSPCVVIWQNIMTKLHQKYIDDAAAGKITLRAFDMPSGIVTATYCIDSGKLIADACRLDPRGSRAEVGYFTADTVPTEYCDCHVKVLYDVVTGGVATSTCPAENVREVGLITVERRFPTQVPVTDAQYVFRTLPAGVRPGSYRYNPFFINLLPPGTYCGVTNYWGATQYNRFCTEHFDFEAYDAGALPFGGIIAGGFAEIIKPPEETNPDGSTQTTFPDE